MLLSLFVASFLFLDFYKLLMDREESSHSGSTVGPIGVLFIRACNSEAAWNACLTKGWWTLVWWQNTLGYSWTRAGVRRRNRMDSQNSVGFNSCLNRVSL